MEHVVADERDVLVVLVDAAEQRPPASDPNATSLVLRIRDRGRPGSFVGAVGRPGVSTMFAGIQQDAQGHREPAVDHPRTVRVRSRT